MTVSISLLTYPNIDPVAVDLGFLQIYWYGLSYLCAILVAWGLLRHRAKVDPTWQVNQIDEIIFYATLGIIIGGRLGSVFFYNLPYYLSDPLEVLKIWRGGMSFHGGLLGVIVALFYYARSFGKRFSVVTDFIVPVVPLGLGFGRVANFINGELWGRPSDLPWSMVFPDPLAGDIPRHPSQLYEACLEGILLFIILWWYSSRPRAAFAVSGLFLVLYGMFRIFVEFFRAPDIHLGFIVSNWLTMGQILSLPMLLVGIFLLLRGKV